MRTVSSWNYSLSPKANIKRDDSMDSAEDFTRIFSVRSGIGRTLLHMGSFSSIDTVKLKMAKKVSGEDGVIIHTNQ